MVIFADTHVHMYPLFDFNVVLDLLQERLKALKIVDLAILYLTERSSNNFFDLLRTGEISLPSDSYHLSYVQNGAIGIYRDGDIPVFIVRGFQLVSSEGLEVLGLGMQNRIKGGLTASDTLKEIRKVGGVGVLPWSLGKWFGQRGQVVKEIIDSGLHDSLFLGDIAMRPIGLPAPKLFRAAQAKGIRLIAGSDPLPFVGEERMIGAYGVLINHKFDHQTPFTSAREALLKAEDLQIVGSRGSLIRLVVRQTQLVMQAVVNN